MRYKYPRTYHLPWSLGYTNDDKVLKSTNHFEGELVVVTEKMDGENTTMSSEYIHARSLDSKDHPSRHWIKKFWGTIRKDIPTNFRICGENLYAQHSISYDNLNSYFYVFNIWDGEYCLDWYDTCEYARMLGLIVVPTLYRGIYNEELIKTLYKEGIEGYVVRKINSFNYNDFNYNVAKFVRLNHVQTNEHWMHSEITPNKLRIK